MKKNIFFFTFAYLSSTWITAQILPAKESAIRVLQKLDKKMAAIKAVSYVQSKAIFYKDDDHNEKDTTKMLLVYQNKNNSILPKYMVNQITDKQTTIYNGVEKFILNKNGMTLDVEVDSSGKSLMKNPFFRQSWANVRNILREIITDDSIQKTLNDTIIQNKKYLVVKIYAPAKRFNALTGFFNVGTDTIQWRYELLIDKVTMLPNQFNVSIQTPQNKENYIKVRFDNIKVNPSLPDEQFWFFTKYQQQYPNHTAKQNDLVKPGAKMPDWHLPIYTTRSTTDTLQSGSLKGKLILLEFWIKNCGYCMTAMPYLNDLQAKFSKDSFQLITINAYDTRKDLEFFYTKYPPNFIMCYNGRKLAESLGIYGFPRTVLINENGTIINVAGFDSEVLKNKISDALSKYRENNRKSGQ